MFPTSIRPFKFPNLFKEMGGILGNLQWRSSSSPWFLLGSLHKSGNQLPIPLPDPWQQKALPWRLESLHTAASQDGRLLKVKLGMIWACFSCGRYIAGTSHIAKYDSINQRRASPTHQWVQVSAWIPHGLVWVESLMVALCHDCKLWTTSGE